MVDIVNGRSRQLSITKSNALEHFEELENLFFDKRRLIIFLDYDGTLSPIVNNPDNAILPNETREILIKLKKLYTTGVITGRSLDKIKKFVKVDGLFYAGSHGYDILGPQGTNIKQQIAVEYLPKLEALRDMITKDLINISGAHVEDNTFSISVHYRNADPSLFSKIKDMVHEKVSGFPEIKCSDGKMVFEIKPKIEWNKGKALEYFLKALNLDNNEDIFTIYIGDDTTDEDAFQFLSQNDNRYGMGILVTETSRPTNANFTLVNTVQVQSFLKLLLEYGNKNNVRN